MSQITYKVLTGDNQQITFGGDLDTTQAIAPYRYDQATHLRLGSPTDVAATTDTGGFGIIALLKRGLTHLSSILSRLPSALDNDQIKVSAGNEYLEVTGTQSVGTTSTVILTIDCKRFNRVSLQIQNTGATALNSFTVDVRYNSTLSWNSARITNANSDFTTNTGQTLNNSMRPVIACGTNPSILAAAGSSWIELNVERYESIRCLASVASGSTTVKLDGICK